MSKPNYPLRSAVIAPVKVLIVGTGFGGLAMAARLKREGELSFVMLERRADVGGVWRDNSYPGCACDVQSNLYSFSFAPNPDWTRYFSPREEIHAYLQKTTRELGLLPFIRFEHEVTSMRWLDEHALWEVETNQGTFHARAVVGAFGSLSDPAIPALRGLSRFQGAVFHSATWPADFQPEGKRVAVVGTGASAIQFIPAIQPHVKTLHLFQRTAPWVMPRHDRPVSERARDLFRRVPWAQALDRLRIYAQRESFVFGFKNPAIMRIKQKTALQNLHQAVRDPVLRKKLTPDYTLGCKRILISNTYYPALAQPNVEVSTDGIEEVTEDSVIGKDGVARPVDAIIFGTGFSSRDLPFARIIKNGQGQTLADAWAGNPRSYMGTTVHGFPNLFLLHGPNIGLGHSSVIFMFEAQVEHIGGVLALMDKRGHHVIEPTAAAQQTFVERMEASVAGTVWTAGNCESWYLDATGKPSSLWPSFTFAYRYLARRIRPEHYQGRKAPLAVPA